MLVLDEFQVIILFHKFFNFSIFIFIIFFLIFIPRRFCLDEPGVDWSDEWSVLVFLCLPLGVLKPSFSSLTLFWFSSSSSFANVTWEKSQFRIDLLTDTSEVSELSRLWPSSFPFNPKYSSITQDLIHGARPVGAEKSSGYAILKLLIFSGTYFG